MDKEPTNYEILEAINNYASKTDERFDRIESQMVTKDYLDTKLADLRGDLVVLVRKEDTKMKKLVEVLERNKVISETDRNEILSMEPFPQLSL